MLRKSLIMRMFDAFSIQRWNDQIRPVDLVEMDKHALKMAIAWCLARYEEDAGAAVDWHDVVRGGVFELLRRAVLSDIKSPVLQRIRTRHPDIYRSLGEWVFRQLDPLVNHPGVKADLRRYLVDDDLLSPLSRRILDAAHFHATWWEFQVLKRMDPGSEPMVRTDRLLNQDLEKHLDLHGMRKLAARALVSDRGGPADFVDLFAHLRFQVRWAQTPRVPRTSVLGHSMLVACLSYFLAREVGACDRRLRNAFFGGLFHDLPESVTRDIVSPVKGAVPELSEVIGAIEQELASEEIYPLVEAGWRDELRYFTTDEFASKVRIDGTVQAVGSDAINAQYDDARFEPIDGELVKAADHLAAYAEAFKSTTSGVRTPQLDEGLQLATRWKGRVVAGVDIGAIYADFQ